MNNAIKAVNSFITIIKNLKYADDKTATPQQTFENSN
jgi:hypothetical protein